MRSYRKAGRSSSTKAGIMGSLRASGVFAILLATGSAASAQPNDVVLQWNEIAQQTVAPISPLVQSRVMAIVQLAVLDAVTVAEGSPVTISAEAAAMAAVHEVLTTLLPDSRPALDASLATGLAGVSDQAAAAIGVAAGRAAAVAVLSDRQGDGWNAVVAYTPRGAAGAWAPTPPAFAAALGPQWGHITPFVLATGDQFRPGPPAAIDSPAHLADLREVQRFGGAASTERRPELTDMARFWIASAVQGWNPVARQASGGDASLLDNARLLAMLNTAIADAIIACFDAKYAYDSWRPVTAIQAGVVGGAADWLPLIVTPPFPAYPSAHACGAGAALTVLTLTFGDGERAITLTSPTAPGVEFTYRGFEEIADQIDAARIYGGIHTREDQSVGRLLGNRVGQLVFEAFAERR